jgi:hypothetical protein
MWEAYALVAGLGRPRDTERYRQIRRAYFGGANAILFKLIEFVEDPEADDDDIVLFLASMKEDLESYLAELKAEKNPPGEAGP